MYKFGSKSQLGLLLLTSPMCTCSLSWWWWGNAKPFEVFELYGRVFGVLQLFCHLPEAVGLPPRVIRLVLGQEDGIVLDLPPILAVHFDRLLKVLVGLLQQLLLLYLRLLFCSQPGEQAGVVVSRVRVRGVIVADASMNSRVLQLLFTLDG